MLILTCSAGESILIELPTGETIRVMVTSVNGNQAGIGTQAPEEIVIFREELPPLEESA